MLKVGVDNVLFVLNWFKSMHESYEGRVGESSFENVMPPFDQIETREVVTRTTPERLLQQRNHISNFPRRCLSLSLVVFDESFIWTRTLSNFESDTYSQATGPWDLKDYGILPLAAYHSTLALQTISVC